MENITKRTVVAMMTILFLSSCQIQEIHEEYMNSFTQNYTVYKKDWGVGTDDISGMYYYYEFREPNLTQFIYERGVMQAFLLVNNNNISPLPFNDYWVGTDGYMWTEQVTCEFRPGYVTFIVKSSDHEWDYLPHYDAYDFRVRFMW